MIPKILHLYWGRNNPLSLLRYMTVVSFSNLNPDWQIHVHYPRFANKGITWDSREHRIDVSGVDDYFDKLREVPRCKLHSFDFDDVAPASGMNEIMRSDLARWKLLAEQGGWWSDFDILFVKPMSSLSVGKSISVVGAYQQTRTGVKHWSIGFLASDGGKFAQHFYEKVLHVAQTMYDPEQYQSCGQLAYTPVLFEWIHDKRICALPPAIVYPIQSWEARHLYISNRKRTPQETIGIHWYGGFEYSQKFEMVINESSILFHHGFLADYLSAAWLQRPV